MAQPSRVVEPPNRSLLGTAKLLIARTATQPAMGRFIGWAWRDRVPSAVGRVDTHDPAISDAVKARLAFRLYETAELRFVRAHLPSHLDVVELGASLGVITRAACANLAPGRRVVAVEANPHLIEPLRANLELAEIADRVTVVHAAVIAGDEATTMVTLGPSSTDARVDDHDEEQSRGRGPDTVEVPAVRLGRLLADNGIDGAYALIADIEGAEAGILRSDAESLANCRFMVIELHDTTHDGRAVPWTDLVADLETDLGFTIAARHGPVVVCTR